MELTATAYQTVVKSRILDKALEGSTLTIVNHSDFHFDKYEVNAVELEWAKSHAANRNSFLVGVLQHRLDGISTFDPYLDACPVDKLLRERFENEVAKMNALRIAKTRLAKHKFRGITSDSALLSFDNVTVDPNERRQNGKCKYHLHICFISTAYIVF